MESSGLIESIFARVKNSPDLIPLLVYLHPPPTRSLTASQADYWTQSLIDYYPETSKDDVLKALAVDPDRTVPLIPYILPKISGPHIITEFQSPAANPSMHRASDDDLFLQDGPPPRFVRFAEPYSISNGLPVIEGARNIVPSSLESERFHFVPQLEGRNDLPEGGSVYESLVNSDSSSEASDAGGPHAGPNIFPPPQLVQMYLQGLRMEIEEIQNLIIFRVDHNAYHLSVAKVIFSNAACGFVLGSFSFLGLRVLSYSPLAALIGGIPLALALILVFGVPVYN